MPEKQLVIIIYGPPGSGKGTQARRLADYFNLEHLDTGRVIEKKIYQPELLNDPIIRRERNNFEKGFLCTPKWVAEIVKEKVKQIQGAGRGIVLSGSPRTLPEVKELLVFLEELYGRENIYIFRLMIKPETSIFRNSHRRLCQQCGQMFAYTPENEKLKKCPQCGGQLVRRILDKPATIKIRLRELKAV